MWNVIARTAVATNNYYDILQEAVNIVEIEIDDRVEELILGDIGKISMCKRKEIFHFIKLEHSGKKQMLIYQGIYLKNTKESIVILKKVKSYCLQVEQLVEQ